MQRFLAGISMSHLGGNNSPLLSNKISSDNFKVIFAADGKENISLSKTTKIVD